MSDELIEMQRLAHKELCEREPEPKCKYCEDVGFVTKTEWVGDDSSYDVEVKCGCKE